MVEKNILKKCEFKSYDWASKPVIGESFFREYDFRDPIKPMMKGGKPVAAAINEDGFRVIGQAYGSYVKKHFKKKKIVVANDYRYYSRGLAYAFMAGVMSTGVDVIDIGVQLTPVIYFAQYHYDLEGAAMITASHNDNGWTGVKLGRGLSDTFGGEHIVNLKKDIYKGDFEKGKGSYERVYDFKDIYIKDILNTVKKHLGKKKIKAVVSGSGGIGGQFFIELFEKLGIETVPFLDKPDWDFPDFNPNPENVKFLEALAKKVKESKADIGLATDGDGDRVGVVDERGEEIFSDRVGLFLSRYLIPESKKKDNKIVIDVKSTNAYAVDPLLKEFDTEIIFSKTGHYFVKKLSKEQEALAGFERSGHFFLYEPYGRGYDDATLYAAWIAVILTNSDKKMSEMLADQPKSYQSPTIEPSVKDDRIKYEIVDKVVKHFKDLKEKGEKFAGLKIEKLITVNGVRFILEGGAWGLVRASSNQPVIVLISESFKSRREMYDIMEALKEHMSNYDIGKYDQDLLPYPGED